MKTEADMRLAVKTLGWCSLAAALAAAAGAATSGFVPNGYWGNSLNAGDLYDSYLHVQDGVGYYCFLDGKSSFGFKINGDSIGTPMNGNNAIRWYPNSGDIQIDGEEKGIGYSTRFKTVAVGKYPKSCVDEEAALHSSAVRPAGLESIRSGSDGTRVDALGRRKNPRIRLISPSPLFPAGARSGTPRDPSL
jgi:hypothetical protein